MRRTLLSFLVVLPCAVLSVGACGGSAFDSGPGTGTGGTGTASGGTSATAGTSSGVAGRAAGGSTGVAGSTGVGGTSSKGGSSSGGTGNVAGTGASAGSAGSAGTDIQACTSNSDCELEPVSCCSCGAGPVSNFTAINSKYVTQYDQRCGTVDCGPCPPTAFNPNDPTFYYVATCQAGRCAVVDLGATDVTACNSASDCSLRSGTACCEGCGSNLVALGASKLPELSKLVCGSEPTSCPACAPSFTGYSADCSNGRCSVLLTPCTTEHPCPL